MRGLIAVLALVLTLSLCIPGGSGITSPATDTVDTTSAANDNPANTGTAGSGGSTTTTTIAGSNESTPTTTSAVSTNGTDATQNSAMTLRMVMNGGMVLLLGAANAMWMRM